MRAEVVQGQWKHHAARVRGVSPDGAVGVHAPLGLPVAHVVVVAHGGGAPLVFAHAQPHYLDILFKMYLF